MARIEPTALELIDSRTATKRLLTGDYAHAQAVEFWPDDRTLAVTIDDNLHLIDTVDGHHTVPPMPLPSGKSSPNGPFAGHGIVALADGRLLIDNAEDFTIVTPDLHSTRLPGVARAGFAAQQPAAASNAPVVVEGATLSASLEVIDITGATPPQDLDLGTGNLLAWAVSADGTRIIGGSGRGEITLIDRQGMVLARRLVSDAVSGLAYLADGRLTVTTADGVLTILDPVTLEPLTRIALPALTLGSPVFADDSRHAVAIVYGSAAILDLNGRGPISTAKSGYIGGALSPDGHRIVAAHPDGTIDVLDGETLGPIAGPWKTTGLGASTAYFVVWSPDGRHVAVRGHDPNIDIVDTETGTIDAVPVSAGANFAETVAFTADGARLVVPDEFAGIEIVDIATKTKVVSAFEPTWGITFDASVRPTGNRVALDAAVGPETLLDSTDLRPAQICEAETGYAVWSADGSRLAVGEHAGDVVVLDANCHRLVTLTGGHASPAVLFSNDGTRVLARDLNGTRLWDTASGRQIGNTFADPNYANGAFGITHDGRLFSLALRDQQLVLFDLDPAAWLTSACATAGRNLTSDEWSRYLGAFGDYRSTCPQYHTS